MAIEVTPEQLALIIVIFVAIFGAWLAGLSYLMWRNAEKAKKGGAGEGETPKPPKQAS